MTLLLTKIYCWDGLLHSWIVFAADRRISKDGKYVATQKKIFQIPYLRAGVGYFGLAEVPTNRNSLSMRGWLTSFIRKNSKLTDLQSFSNVLADNLNKDIPAKCKKKNISGFHIAGYNSSGLPEFWYVRNVQDDCVTTTGTYKAREDFLRKHAFALGYDGKDPRSVRSRQVQIYRNGDMRAHVAAWENIDESFGKLFEEPEFKRLKNIKDIEEWSKFKMELISYFYKKYCKISLLARPIDSFSIRGKYIEQNAPPDRG